MYHSLEVLDNIRLNFSPQGLFTMNITLAFIMFGVALDIKKDNFVSVIKNPKIPLIGMISQFILLPAITYAIVKVFNFPQSIALGMILVASCPGGNISNFISSLAKADVALSISLTAVATTISIFMTPFNFAFWGGLFAKTSPLLRPITIDPFQMFQTVFILLGIPLVLGLAFAKKFPNTTKKIIGPIKIASIFAFFGFIVGALAANFDNFMNYIGLIIFIVILHNALAILTGYGISSIFKLPQIDKRTIAIETGIQNSGLALVLIFNPKIFPADLQLGGMAFIAACWGIWHIVSGMALAFFWSKRKIKLN